MSQSITEALPEDIIVIILKNYGLHATLGSTCRSMRQLSLSEKCVGSVCIYISEENVNADPSFLPYHYAHTLRISRNIDNEEITCLFDDSTWPFLVKVDIDVRMWFRLSKLYFKIYAPRVISYEHISDKFWINFFEEIKKRMPMLKPPACITIYHAQEFDRVIKHSTKGLTLTCCNTIFGPPMKRGVIKDIILNNNNVAMFTDSIRIPGNRFEFTKQFIDIISKVVHTTINIYPDHGYCEDIIDVEDTNLAETTVVHNVKRLYDICYMQNITHNNNQKRELIVQYDIRVDPFYDDQERASMIQTFSSYISNQYPKITFGPTQLTKPKSNVPTHISLIFKYICT